MMKLKLTAYRLGLKKMDLIRMVLIGVALVSQACERENEFRDYRDVKRELILNDFDDALSKASNGLEKLVESGGLVSTEEKEVLLAGTERRQHLQSILKPVLDKSADLFKTYGISNSFLKRELGNPDDPRLILAAIWIAEAERRSLRQQDKYQAHLADLVSYLPFFFQEEAKPDWMDCMLVAVGVDAIVEFAKGNITEAVAKKAIRKIASRTLGWIGVGLALYEYGNCMNWY